MQQTIVQLNHDIHYSNVLAELNKVLDQLGNETDCLAIDCGHINKCDSSITALFIEILRHAKRANLTVKFSNIPAQVASILNLSNLNPFIPT